MFGIDFSSVCPAFIIKQRILIIMSTDGNNFFAEDASHLAQIIDNINAGIWEFNIITKDVKWSAGFYTSLDYTPGEIECSQSYFLESLIYHQDKAAFLKALYNRNNDQNNTTQIRLLTKNGGYQWFESTTRKWDDNGVPKLTGSLININNWKITGLRAAQNESLFNQFGGIAKLSGFDIDVATLSLSVSKEVYDIYELNGGVILSLEEAISFFEPAFRASLTEAIDKCIKFCKPFDLELLFRTAKNNITWVRTKGVPIIDDFGKCVAVRGIIQDVDHVKKKGLAMQSTLNTLNDQNRRLQNFAYIVSHNLRSHTGNLQFMVNLHEESDSEEEKAEVFAHIKSLSNNLSTTIGHLNEIVKINTETDEEKETLQFEEVFKNVVALLGSNIENINAKIEYDFSKCPTINYIPAYLESIFQNLLTNALKYRHPDRPPVINCRTVKDNEHIYMLFEDNGVGIDLERYGDKVFGMYKTFHQNSDAKGIGLFITRNQIESLGGSIKINSTVNVGTKFTIRFI